MDAIPLKTQEATHVASEFVDRFISVFGVSLQLYTDLGSNFESKVSQEVCNFFDEAKLQFENPSLMEWLKGQTVPSKI